LKNICFGPDSVLPIRDRYDRSTPGGDRNATRVDWPLGGSREYQTWHAFVGDTSITEVATRATLRVLGQGPATDDKRTPSTRSLTFPWCKNQDVRTKTKPLITLGFSGAEIWCRIISMKYGYARVSTDGQSIEPTRMAYYRPSRTSSTSTLRARRSVWTNAERRAKYAATTSLPLRAFQV
jgi:hypothetical protein